MSKAVMKQALDAFEAIMFEKNAESCQLIAKNARYSLREALAQPEHNHLSDAMRLYQAVDRLATQAGEDASETIDWLCGEHGGMFKLFEAYFSPKPLANQTVGSGSPIDSSTNIAGSSIDSSDSSTHSADSSTHMNHASMKHLLNLIKNGWIESAQELIEAALAQPEQEPVAWKYDW